MTTAHTCARTYIASFETCHLVEPRDFGTEAQRHGRIATDQYVLAPGFAERTAVQEDGIHGRIAADEDVSHDYRMHP